MYKNLTSSSAAILLTLAVASASPMAVAEDGAALYTSKACNTCHGDEGRKPLLPIYPKLAGQNQDYLVAQMKDIKSGARANGQSAAMKAIIAAVSDEEMTAIGGWLAGLQ